MSAVAIITEHGRSYFAAADLAAICGTTESVLDRRFRPYAWAMPRDFIWKHRRLWFARASLPDLVEAFFDAGESAGALRLREWLTALASAEAKFFDPGTVPNSSADGTAASSEHRPAAPAAPSHQHQRDVAAGSTPERRPARIEASAGGWARHWEDRQS